MHGILALSSPDTKYKNKNKTKQILESIDIRFWYAVREYLLPGCDCCKRHDPPCPSGFFLWRVRKSWGRLPWTIKIHVQVWGSRAELKVV